MENNNYIKLTAIKIGANTDERTIWDSRETMEQKSIILDGSFSGKRNDVSQLGFQIHHEHPLFDWLEPLSTMIYMWRSNRWEFTGRIITIEGASGTDGNIVKNINCESLEALLNDTELFDESSLGDSVVNITRSFIDDIINVEQPSLRQIQFISFTDPFYDVTPFHPQTKTGTKAIKSLNQFFDSVGATINIRRYDPDIDGGDQLPSWALVMNVYYKEHSVFKINQPIQIGINMRDLKTTIDATQVVNRLYVVGKDGLDLSGGVTSGKIPYVENAEGIARYGVIEAYREETTLTNIDALRQWGIDFLWEFRRPIISIQASPYDLSIIDDNLDSYKVGNIVRVIHPPFDIDEELFLEEVSYSLLTPAEVTTTLANKKPSYFREVVK